jgi:hypothetical protein
MLMEEKKRFWKGVYFAITYYIVGGILSGLFWDFKNGPCSPSIGMAIAMMFFALSVLVGIIFFFIKRPFYRAISITFLIFAIVFFILLNLF